MRQRSFLRRRSLIVLAFVLSLSANGVRAMAPPQIVELGPSRGPSSGGTVVTIIGSGLSGTTQVSFGTVAAASFSVQSDSFIQATSPPGVTGLLVDISVTTPEGTATLTEAFGYGPIPIAVADSYSTLFGTTLSVNAPGVLANDNPNGGGGVVVGSGTSPSNGTVTLTANGGFTYTPNAGFAGTDSFTYRSQNSTGFSNFATVSISVGPPSGPLAPTGLYASEIRGSRVTLRLTLPAVGPPPTALIVEGGTTPGSAAQSLVAPPTPLITFDAPSGAFYVRVRAQSGTNVSAPSNEILIFVNTPAVPSAPASLTAGVDGNTLSVAWRNTYVGGEPTQVVLDITGSVAASLPVGLLERATFTGVPPGTYTLSLRATNASGSSFPSTPVTVTVPGTCSPPLPPTSVLAYKVGSTIFVVWEPPMSGAAPTSYVLTVSGALVASFPTTTRSLSGSVGPGSYTLAVVSTSSCGASAATASQTVTIP